jgi:hypothetical protein
MSGPGSLNPVSSSPLSGAQAPLPDPDIEILAQQGVSVIRRDDALGALGYYDVTSSGGHTEPLNLAQIGQLAREVRTTGMLPPQWNVSHPDPLPGASGGPTPALEAPSAAVEKTVYHPGVEHNHKPSGRWDDFQGTVKDPFPIGTVCRHSDPAGVLTGAAMGKLMDKKIATEHLKWYANGKGGEFNENKNIEIMMKADSGIQELVLSKLPKDQKSGTFSGHVRVDQQDYKDQDLRNAFGAIDRLDFKVDYDKQTIKVWFEDRYEWHPVGDGYYDKQVGDEVRPTNCVHAAAVEMKLQGAADYWMKGESTLPLSDLKASEPRTDNWVEENPAGGLPWVQKHGL